MEDEQILKNAQYRKSLAIAYFNATNAAIELLKNSGKKDTELQEDVVAWRDWFLAEHKRYYAENIANIGKPYDAKETIKNLKVETTLEGLKKAWLLLSEDERRDDEIIKAVKELKAKYANK